jgi:hypothetical protein
MFLTRNGRRPVEKEEEEVEVDHEPVAPLKPESSQSNWVMPTLPALMLTRRRGDHAPRKVKMRKIRGKEGGPRVVPRGKAVASASQDRKKLRKEVRNLLLLLLLLRVLLLLLLLLLTPRGNFQK